MYVYIVYKVVGFFLILISGVFISNMALYRLNYRIKHLEKICMMLFYMEYIICDEGKYLAEAFQLVSSKNETKAEKLFYEAGTKIEKDNKPFKTIWNELMHQFKTKLLLAEEEIDIICKLGDSFGMLNKEKQRTAISNILELLQKQVEIRKSEKKCKEKPILYTGVLGGMAIGIMLL